MEERKNDEDYSYLENFDLRVREGVPQKKSRIVGNFPYFAQTPPPPGIREIHQKMKKNFFAFLNELDHSKQSFKKVGKMIFFWLPPPF